MVDVISCMPTSSDIINAQLSLRNGKEPDLDQTTVTFLNHH